MPGPSCGNNGSTRRSTISLHTSGPNWHAMPLSSDVETRGPPPGAQLKRAMVLRLSSETFAELKRAITGGVGSGVPPIEVQFGDNEPSVRRFRIP